MTSLLQTVTPVFNYCMGEFALLSLPLTSLAIRILPNTLTPFKSYWIPANNICMVNTTNGVSKCFCETHHIYGLQIASTCWKIVFVSRNWTLELAQGLKAFGYESEAHGRTCTKQHRGESEPKYCPGKTQRVKSKYDTSGPSVEGQREWEEARYRAREGKTKEAEEGARKDGVKKPSGWEISRMKEWHVPLRCGWMI